MSNKIVVGPFGKGLKLDRPPFYIDNENFPQLINAYQWRGRVKRKRGTRNITRLTRYIDTTVSSYQTPVSTITLDGSGNGNLLTGFSLQSTASIVPGTVIITGVHGSYTDPSKDGTLSPSGSINYASGAITIAAEAGNAISVKMDYYPGLPVMGIEDFADPTQSYPGTLYFDTVYAYNGLTSEPYNCYSVSFFKNPAVSPSLPGYVAKTNETQVTWNGQDYQQFWTVNYQGALWATNGVTNPFSITNIGMQFLSSSEITSATQINATTVDFVIPSTPLVVGDFVYTNEFTGGSGASLNFQTGYVTVVTSFSNTYRVVFPFANIGNTGLTPGMIQYLTNRSDVTRDCLRWYDGDPTDGTPSAPALTGHKGWVNFCPPISQSNFPIADLPSAQYYLVGAKMIVPFKDRLLFIGPVVQTSANSPKPIYLQDTVIYSQNGTPYYTASFNGSPTSAATTFNTVLAPDNQTATAPAYFSDSLGFGGFITAGIDEPINTVSSNEDVLVMGLEETQTKFVYTGNDALPFNFFIINSELGSSSTFSTINMDRGVLTRGPRGYIITSQVETQRFDLDIPDQVFQIRLVDNGNERVTAQRDFINEWVYFSYPDNESNWRFPTQSLMYNYRDQSWSIFNETYTTYGQFRPKTGFTWLTVGEIYTSWSVWNDPWNAGQTTLLQQQILGGNQQGFIMQRDVGTGEGTSLFISDLSGNTVSCPDHCLSQGDYIQITGCLGTVASQVNGKVFSVTDVSQNSFKLNPPISGGTYLGNGEIIRYYVPFIQTKQFPVSWNMSRKTRLGPQQYLLSTTQNSQVTLLIYLSQDASNAYNDTPIVPLPSENNSLVYSTVLYTCPESTNLGLTPANINLNMVTAETQAQIWHRINTSLLGDTVQVAITLSDAQMRDPLLVNQTAEIELHGMILEVSPSMLLA